jgi:hypothetical protein
MQTGPSGFSRSPLFPNCLHRYQLSCFGSNSPHLPCSWSLRTSFAVSIREQVLPCIVLRGSLETMKTATEPPKLKSDNIIVSCFYPLWTSFGAFTQGFALSLSVKTTRPSCCALSCHHQNMTSADPSNTLNLGDPGPAVNVTLRYNLKSSSVWAARVIARGHLARAALPSTTSSPICKVNTRKAARPVLNFTPEWFDDRDLQRSWRYYGQ